jgi:hypothetical protein
LKTINPYLEGSIEDEKEILTGATWKKRWQGDGTLPHLEALGHHHASGIVCNGSVTKFHEELFSTTTRRAKFSYDPPSA